MDFRNLYMPLTAGNRNLTYIERAPVEALAPYVHCYWYYEDILKDYDNLVIPDTCVDIIFSVDKEGKVTATFCGVNDRPYFRHIAASFTERKAFAVRFYVWSFSLLSGETLQNTRNVFLEAELYLSYYVNEMKKIINIDSTFDEFIKISDKLLTKRQNERYQDTGFMNAVYQILKNKGNIRIDKLAEQCFIGKRQLERLFYTRMDLSPKRFVDLIRYQNVWKGVLLNRDINELVFQLGYSDQSHLLRKFKNYHGITLPNAKIFAYRTEKIASQINDPL